MVQLIVNPESATYIFPEPQHPKLWKNKLQKELRFVHPIWSPSVSPYTTPLSIWSVLDNFPAMLVDSHCSGRNTLRSPAGLSVYKWRVIQVSVSFFDWKYWWCLPTTQYLMILPKDTNNSMRLQDQIKWFLQVEMLLQDIFSIKGTRRGWK